MEKKKKNFCGYEKLFQLNSNEFKIIKQNSRKFYAFNRVYFIQEKKAHRDGIFNLVKLGFDKQKFL